MSAGEKAFGLFKTIMLVTERFDALDEKMKAIGSDQSALARSHADLSLRVAEIEGYLRAATVTPFGNRPRIERK